jgi:uncharacterized membrane protein
MSKTVKLIVTFSFLLNMVLVGVVVGGLYKKHNAHTPRFENMSAETREVLKQSIQKNREAMRENVEQMRGHKEELKVIITAEEFDAAAYDMKMDQVLSIRNTMMVQKSKALGQTLSSLSQEQRTEMSGHILRRLSGKHKGKRKDHNGLKHKEK